MRDLRFARRIPELLAERWGHLIEADERFEAIADRDEETTTVTLVVVGPAAESRAEFECALQGGDEETFEAALDAADLVLSEWLEAERPRLTGVPEQRAFQGRPVRVTARLVKPALEAHADALLDGEVH